MVANVAITGDRFAEISVSLTTEPVNRWGKLRDFCRAADSASSVWFVNQAPMVTAELTIEPLRFFMAKYPVGIHLYHGG